MRKCNELSNRNDELSYKLSILLSKDKGNKIKNCNLISDLKREVMILKKEKEDLKSYYEKKLECFNKGFHEDKINIINSYEKQIHK